MGSDDIKKAVAEEVARQLAELKAKEAPKPEFKPMSDAEHRDRVHQMRERQANILDATQRNPRHGRCRAQRLHARRCTSRQSRTQQSWQHGPFEPTA